MQKQKEKHKQKLKERGITLIALVITVIVLLILAGVALAALTGDSGILSNAEKAKDQTKYANAKEQVALAVQGALTEGLGRLTTENLKIELDKIFGSEGYKLTETNNGWTIIVDGYKFEIYKNGEVVYVGKDGDKETGTTKNKYGFYYDELYEGTITLEGQKKDIGYIFHLDGSAELFLKDEQMTLGNLMCIQVMPEKTIQYDQMLEQGMAVSEDGLIITMPATEYAEEQILTSTLKETHGLYFNYEYSCTQSSEANETDVIKTFVFYEEGVVSLTEKTAIIGGTSQTDTNIQEGMTYIGHDYQIQSDESVMGYVSVDGKYILIGDMILTRTGEELEREEVTFINVEDVELLEGKTQKLTLTTTPSWNVEKLTYTSSNTSVATVDSRGNVTAVSAGEAIITVAGSISTDVTDSCKVIVKEKVTAIEIAEKSLKLEKGEIKQLTVTTTPSNIGESLTYTSSNTAVATVDSEGNITAAGVGNAIITVAGSISKNITATCEVAVLVAPTDSTVASNTTPTFSTDYGLVDVIWLDGTTNTVATEPNEPNLYTELGNSKLMPVTWTYIEGTDGNDGTWVEDSVAKSTWYSYNANSGSDGKIDNTTSMWANAKNTTDAGESYFVWIPRYAYRITYYSDAKYTNVTGYYDGWGLWNPVDGTLNYEIDEGIEVVEFNGNKYIVHPAFMGIGSEELGGGFGKDENGISGFWVAKYEMSRKEADMNGEKSGYDTTFKSVPNVQSARTINIGDKYAVSLEYDKSKESHLMKNSEWGAVAYLTQSQYGRNGYEVDGNNSSTCITGNGAGTVGNAIQEAGVRYYYNTKKGAKASSTGNIYGIYDLSGGASEAVASYNKLGLKIDESDCVNMTKNAKDSEGNYISTKYITAYENGTSDFNSSAIFYLVGKVGDATKEVRKSSKNYNWFDDVSGMVDLNYRFFLRGGDFGTCGPDNGPFRSNVGTDAGSQGVSFRVILAE